MGHSMKESRAAMNESGNPAATPSSHRHRVIDEVVSKSRYWWLLLVTGVVWIVIGIVVLRFSYATVTALAILFGVFCAAAAVTEAMAGAMSSRTWRIARWLLAALIVVVGVVAFLAVKATLAVLAAVMSFYFIFRGCFDVIAAIAAHKHPAWRVLLIVGLAELAIGFWAAGPWHLSAVRLVAWVAAGILLHGIGQIASAFLVRGIGHDAAYRCA
jgi:uncharacterized membrane protein HdeD (DUF308 family)